LLQGPIASWNADEAVVDPGMVTVADSEVGQLVSEPTGTSEYWYANCAEEDGATISEVGGALAALETVTDNPLTIVTVSGAPLPERSASMG
jgi:hypothetical protein